MSDPLPLEEAQARLLAMAGPLPSETVAAEAALGRYLAEPLVAARTQPPADLSAMDGYAIAGPGPWQVVGESRGGLPYDGSIATGESVRISTGAVVPEGADRILVQEHAARDDDQLSIAGEDPAPGRHIRKRGFDFAVGDALLAPGTRIGARQLALAIGAGRPELAVHRLPRVAILDSGSELATSSGALEPGQIPASNGAMLAAMARGLASDLLRVGPVPDDLHALGEALARAEGCDVLVTSGGASVGDHDLLRPALESWGAQIAFWRVAIRPGKPLLVARRGATLVLGLPGNPVSAYVTAFLFMLPVLRKLAGAREPLPQSAPMRCTTDLPPRGHRGEFVRATIERGTVTPLSERDSSALASLAAADSLIWRPPHAPGTKAGTDVPAYRLENGGIA